MHRASEKQHSPNRGQFILARTEQQVSSSEPENRRHTQQGEKREEETNRRTVQHPSVEQWNSETEQQSNLHVCLCSLLTNLCLAACECRVDSGGVKK